MAENLNSPGSGNSKLQFPWCMCCNIYSLAPQPWIMKDGRVVMAEKASGKMDVGSEGVGDKGSWAEQTPLTLLASTGRTTIRGGRTWASEDREGISDFWTVV